MSQREARIKSAKGQVEQGVNLTIQRKSNINPCDSGSFNDANLIWNFDCIQLYI